ncbi:MAG: Na-translocating system protein MpsC family protein [Solirubrobacteraceae bacterium]
MSKFASAVSPEQGKSKSSAHGDVLTAISDGMVALLKEFYGRGPTRAKSYYEDDLVVCVLRGGFSRVEQTLLEGGRHGGHPPADGVPGSHA